MGVDKVEGEFPIKILGIKLKAGVGGIVDAGLHPDGVGVFDALGAQVKCERAGPDVGLDGRDSFGEVVGAIAGMEGVIQAEFQALGGESGGPNVGRYGHFGDVEERFGAWYGEEQSGSAEVSAMPPVGQAFASLVDIRAV